MYDHNYFMEEALKEATKAFDAGEVPIGAIIVLDNKIIAKACNQVEATHDPTAHAEILAIRKAAELIGNHRLTGMTIYVTIEPCGMCTTALVWARLKQLIYGADDPKTGTCGTRIDLIGAPWLNHKIEVIKGIQKERCQQLMQEFFTGKRSATKTRRHKKDLGNSSAPGPAYLLGDELTSLILIS